MSPRHACPRILIAVLLGGAMLPIAALAETWQENIGLLVRVDGKPDGSAQLFDSEDYQRMLLVLGEPPSALVLDLADGTVGAVPRDSVRIDENGTADLGSIGIEYLADCERKDVAIHFALEQKSVEIVPLPPLIGETTLQRLLEIKPSYAVAAKAYKPDGAAVAALKGVTASTEIRVYFGTWCQLCKKVVPNLIRAIELAANPKIQVRFFSVDENLSQPEAEIRASAIAKTPTILVRQGSGEIGRIEEKAEKSVEGDLAKILTRP